MNENEWLLTLYGLDFLQTIQKLTCEFRGNDALCSNVSLLGAHAKEFSIGQNLFLVLMVDIKLSKLYGKCVKMAAKHCVMRLLPYGNCDPYRVKYRTGSNTKESYSLFFH